ncbi:AsmA family protein [Devosia equisanguinis]|uniref:AsmA family protein n=1 Tax=Devosia equisanguinis TaxID=2490941 RepID=A0A3S4GJ16_9HYPH|nr:AsmA family protein [Devosia equisanguinis]
MVKSRAFVLRDSGKCLHSRRFQADNTPTVLNRVYIAVGLLAILVLASAFIAPRFIQWSDYRDRMEELASTVLGEDVTIRGDIEFSLLPQPRLSFTDVVVGVAEAPSATVAGVEAEFALMDFLRDNYHVTSLVLYQPVVELAIDENGLFGSGIDMSGAGAGVALAHARIERGSVRLSDLRSGELYAASGIDGDLRLSSFSGPFQFQGAMDSGGSRYEVRFNSGTLDGDGNTKISAYLRDLGGAFSIGADGMFAAGVAPKFDGTLTYKQAPEQAAGASDIRGSLVLESKVTASTDRVVLSGYTLHPDENRAGMRLTGSASVQLGERRSFDAVVSGGVFSLPPRAATEVPAQLPYEVVRLLAELPAPLIPPMEGTLDIDLAEVGLRGFSLRDLRLDATSDGKSWDIAQAVARLPGDGELRFAGKLSDEDGAPGFRGTVALSAARLDALAQLWRRPREDNPLFNMPGGLEGRVILGSGALGLSSGVMTLDGQSHGFELRLGFGEEKRLDAVLNLDDLDIRHTAALQALAPDITADGSFALSFPEGSFLLTAQTLDLMGLPATDVVAEGQWSPTAIRLSRLGAGDWGGVGFNGAVRVAGTLDAPQVTGSGQLSVADATATGLAKLYELAALPQGWRGGLVRAWPANLRVALEDSETGAGQVLTLNGSLDGSKFDLRTEMTEGLLALARADLRLVASLEADEGGDLVEQLGLGPVELFTGEGSGLASLFLEGNLSTGLDGRVALGQGSDILSYSGHIDIGEAGVLSGEGTLDATLAEAGGLATLLGARGASLPGVDANATLSFEGSQRMTLSDITGVSGRQSFTGQLSMAPVGQVPSFTGSLNMESLDVTALAASIFGAEGMVPGAQVWPEGPLALNPGLRPTRGEIAVRADTLLSGAQTLAGATSFAYSWDQQAIGLDRFETEIGGGTLSLVIGQCCAGALSDRALAGRLSLAGVEMGALLPTAPGLSGRVDAGLQFEGTGASLADAMAAMTGEGNFAIADFAAQGLTPGVYPATAALTDVLNTDAEALQTLIGMSLSQGDFTAQDARGTVAIAGGVVRVANLIVDGEGGRLAGSVNLDLSRLAIDGAFVLTPLGYVDPTGLIENDNARIVARLAGTLMAPLASIDLTEMVAAIQVRANELEVDRLEELRLADEERQRAAAEERNRLIAEQRRLAAEEAARKAAEDAARAPAVEPETPEEAASGGSLLVEPNQPQGPLNLGFQPGVSVNQPVGPPVNQPFQF